MASCLSLHAPLTSLQRDFSGLLQAAVAEVADSREPFSTRVHELRKRLKRARAWAQFLPEPLARTVDHALRDAHKGVGARRDQDAALEAIARLLVAAQAARSEPAVTGFGTLREQLRRQARERPEVAATSSDADVTAVRENLYQVVQMITAAQLDDDFRALAEGASDTARRSRKAMRRAIRSGDPLDYHRWRKWMKYHWFHLRYLDPLWPELLRVEAKAAERAAEALGQTQDIELVRGALAEGVLPKRQQRVIETLIEREQGQLMAVAASTGQLIHAETPSAFEKRLLSYGRTRSHALEVAP